MMTLLSTGARLLAEAGQDLRVAGRRLRREPGLALAVLCTIGLGLGAASAIFVAADAALLRPPPFASPDQLVHLWEERSGSSDLSPTSYPTFQDWRERTTTLSGLEGYNPSNVTVGVGSEAMMLRGAQVTAGFFRLLGVPMARGRDFAEGGDRGAGGPVAIISHRFASVASGRPGQSTTITINGRPFEVIGILPASFHFAPLQDADIWVPLATDGPPTDRAVRWVGVVGRLRDGLHPSQAREDLASIMATLANEYPRTLAGRTVRVTPLRDALLGDVKPILLSLGGAVALLLLAMATNLALLMFTRYLARRRELALRSALGATRTRLARQLFAESLLLAAGGAALGVLLGSTATTRLLAAIPEGLRIGMPYLADAGLGAAGVAFISGTALGLSLLFGLAPALLASGKNPGRLDTDRTVTVGSRDRRIRRGLVVAQVSLTFVLLVMSGLLITSLRNLLATDIGFADPAGLVSARVSLSGERYQEPAAQQQFYQALLAEMGGLPGIKSVAAISRLPLGGSGITTFEATDHPTPPASQPRAALRIVAGDYFGTMGIPLRSGRSLVPGDREDSPPVVVVSAQLADLLAQGGPVLGRQIHLAATGDVAWQVVGVVGNVQTAALDAEAVPAVYLSHLQLAENRMSLVSRTGLGAGQVATAMRTIVRRLDPAVPVYAARSLADERDESRAVFTRRFPLTLSLTFALAALILSLIGLYSLCAHEVVTRRREFGIRLALGASPAGVRGIVLRNGLTLTAWGVGLGVLAALWGSRALRALLFEVSGGDWRVFGAVAALVTGTALLATLTPALRASRVDLATVLREE